MFQKLHFLKQKNTSKTRKKYNYYTNSYIGLYTHYSLSFVISLSVIFLEACPTLVVSRM